MPLKREHFAEFYTELDAGEAVVTVTVSGQAKLQRDIARRRGRETSRSFFCRWRRRQPRSRPQGRVL